MADNTRQGTNQHIERIIEVWPGKHLLLDEVALARTRLPHRPVPAAEP